MGVMRKVLHEIVIPEIKLVRAENAEIKTTLQLTVGAGTTRCAIPGDYLTGSQNARGFIKMGHVFADIELSNPRGPRPGAGSGQGACRYRCAHAMYP